MDQHHLSLNKSALRYQESELYLIQRVTGILAEAFYCCEANKDLTKSRNTKSNAFVCVDLIAEQADGITLSAPDKRRDCYGIDIDTELSGMYVNPNGDLVWMPTNVSQVTCYALSTETNHSPEDVNHLHVEGALLSFAVQNTTYKVHYDDAGIFKGYFSILDKTKEYTPSNPSSEWEAGKVKAILGSAACESNAYTFPYEGQSSTTGWMTTSFALPKLACQEGRPCETEEECGDGFKRNKIRELLTSMQFVEMKVTLQNSPEVGDPTSVVNKGNTKSNNGDDRIGVLMKGAGMDFTDFNTLSSSSYSAGSVKLSYTCADFKEFHETWTGSTDMSWGHLVLDSEDALTGTFYFGSKKTGFANESNQHSLNHIYEWLINRLGKTIVDFLKEKIVGYYLDQWVASNAIQEWVSVFENSLLNRCVSSNFQPYPNGITPMCFWYGYRTGPPTDWYTPAVIAGVVDGVYIEAKGIYDLSNSISDLTVAFARAPVCGILDLTKDNQGLQDMTTAIEQKFGTSATAALNAVINTLKEVRSGLEWINNCEETRATLEGFFNTVETIWAVLSNTEVKTAIGLIEKEIKDYYNNKLFSDDAYISAYHWGKTLAFVATLYEPGKGTKLVQGVKNFSDGIKTFITLMKKLDPEKRIWRLSFLQKWLKLDINLRKALKADFEHLANTDRGKGSKFLKFLVDNENGVKAWKGFFDFSNLRVNTAVLDHAKNWGDDLFTKFKNVGSKNPTFYDEVNNFPVVAKYFDEGFPIIKKNNPANKEVELDMYALDRSRPERTGGSSLFEPTNPQAYVPNTTKSNYNDIHLPAGRLDQSGNPILGGVTPSGKIRHNNGQAIHTQTGHEGLMYAVDELGVIHIGSRGGAFPSGFPHPTLIGGVNPNVKCAGMIKFNQGKIVEVSNTSGHFKPTLENLNQIKSIFQNKFSVNSTDAGSWANVFKNVAP